MKFGSFGPPADGMFRTESVDIHCSPDLKEHGIRAAYCFKARLIPTYCVKNFVAFILTHALLNQIPH